MKSMNALQQAQDKYTQLNKLALRGEVAVLGSTFMAGFDLGEFIQRFSSTRKFYNRSVKGLTIEDAKEIYDGMIKPIIPGDIVIAIGEADLEREQYNEKDFVEAYKKLIQHIRTTLPQSMIYVASIVEAGKDSTNINMALKLMAKGLNVEFLDLHEALQIKVDGMEYFFVNENGHPTIMGYIVLWNKLTRTCEMNTWTVDDPWQKVGASNAISMCMEAM